MIHLKAYDIEVLPNFFSIVIIDVDDYLRIFKDACITNKKGKQEPVPLTEIFTVEQIKERLNSVKYNSFYITDTDDSQLLQMMSYLNNLHRIDSNNIFHQTHMFGYNSMAYDKLMIAGLLAFFGTTNTTKELITKLYELSKKIIDLQDNRDMSNNDYLLKSLRTFGLPYKDIDVMRVFALNKAGMAIDKNGNKKYFGKGAKQTAINLKWFEILEHELPPISDIDRFYYDKLPRYRDLRLDELNILINKWDRYLINDWIPDIMHYNKNDVFIVCEIIRLYKDEIKLRYQITKSYEVDVLNSSRSNIADRLFEKFYSEFSGLKPFQWKGKKTIRTIMSFKRIILPFIEFKTPELQLLLAEMKKTSVTSLGKDSFKKEIKLGNLVYTIATGGLHSQDIPRELRSKIKTIDSSTGEFTWDNIEEDSFIYVHFDIASFYPSLIVNFNVAPAHLNEGCFVKLVQWLRDTRVEAKHSKEEYIDGIPKDVLAQVLKIVINSIYGKLGYDEGDICDRLAVLNVTINGQLLIMMLCEELELNNIEVVSANTDGIVVKLYKKDKKLFDEITTKWCEKTKFGADSEEYLCYINRDINNYLIKETNGKISYKGALNPKMYAIDLSKGYDMPVVAQAVVNYFIEGKPIMESLYECKDILDFCKAQNMSDKKYRLDYISNEGSKQIQCKTRFYVSTNGGSLIKSEKLGFAKTNLCQGYKVTPLNTLDDTRIELRNINYQYYYDECMKIIDPIKLNISPNLKANPNKKTKSGKALIKKYSGSYLSLFDDNDE